MSSAGPIWGSELWRQVVSRAGGICQCTGQCGAKHSQSHGRCDMQEGRRGEHLIAAPAVAGLSFAASARLTAPELIALCVRCFGGRNRITQKSTPAVPAEGLF